VAAAAISLFISNESHAARRRAVVSPAPPFNVLFTEGGYADRTSVTQGSAIGFHVASSVSPVLIRIVNLTDRAHTLATLGPFPSQAQDCSGRYTEGCGWARTTTFDVPPFWPSGYYAAQFTTSFGDRFIPFVVKEDDPGSTSPVVVVSSTHTWQANNAFAGNSVFPSDDPFRAKLVSYDRPYLEDAGLGSFDSYERHFVDWMTNERRPFEVLTDVDLEDPEVLVRYNAVVIPGHAEYWTAAARTTLEQFSQNGGHIAILNGNTMWWQVRLENENRTIAAYTGSPTDPALDSSSPFTSTHFYSSPVNNPENRLLGASYRNGGYANRVDAQTNVLKPLAERTPWTVTNASHWIFAGTNLRDGEPFGRETTGLEVDGVVFNCDSFGRILGPDGSDDAPLNYEILAVTPASSGWATMGFLVHPSGGAVFNAASNGWVWGLETNEDVESITRNVLDRFASGARFAYTPNTTTVVAQDLFNCSQGLPVTGWISGENRPRTTAACAYEGAAGLELTGEQAIAIARRLAPRGEPRNDVYLRLYVNADELQQRTTFPMPLIALEQQTGSTATRAAFLELDATNGKQIRLARLSPAGTFFASPWVPLTSGWHLAEMHWVSPGTMTLQVDRGAAISLENPDAGQFINRAVIAYPKPELTTAGRVCVDAFAVGTETLGSVPALR
jgi:hypothetical protein